MFRLLPTPGVIAAIVVVLTFYGPLVVAENPPGFLTADELINIYTPAEPGEPDGKTLTRGLESDAEGNRGLAGVRKSKAGHASQQASTDTAQPARRHSFVNILFGINSVNLKNESYRQLDEIGKALGVIMVKHSSATFVVEGHTDSMGTEARNAVLSLNRAEAIRKYLIGRFGFDENRIESVGFGERVPVAANDTEAGRMLNRRVEIILK